jgi:TPR repeat protein
LAVISLNNILSLASLCSNAFSVRFFCLCAQAYVKGAGVEASRSLALKWYRKAAAAGLPHARCTLAALLHATWVKAGNAADARVKAPGDDAEAAKWATLAADQVRNTNT